MSAMSKRGANLGGLRLRDALLSAADAIDGTSAIAVAYAFARLVDADPDEHVHRTYIWDRDHWATMSLADRRVLAGDYRTMAADESGAPTLESVDGVTLAVLG